MKKSVLRMIQSGKSHRVIQKETGVPLATISKWRNEHGNRVLVIGDIHEPCGREGYLEFCKAIEKKYKTNQTVFVGDIVDWQGISFHANNPEAPGVVDEYLLAHQCIQEWYRAFPNAVVTIGNHDKRVIQMAESVNIPARFIRDYKDIWDTPKWEWKFEHTIDDVYYFHGTGVSGEYPHKTTAKQMSMSVVMGHYHSIAGIEWMANPQKRWFGMSVGCGIDDAKYAFAYGIHQKKKSLVSCGVVIDGHPYHEMMFLEKYG